MCELFKWCVFALPILLCACGGISRSSGSRSQLNQFRLGWKGRQTHIGGLQSVWVNDHSSACLFTLEFESSQPAGEVKSHTTQPTIMFRKMVKNEHILQSY
ncbi:hypothetical protein BC939DRAFT_464442 [Gamsiella multidivaricata]|uniref:uncharacterized protein n=1 Tax=Gamsiella multidivaricata TaxID=101098 RepID=UPI00221E6673|nr:uncharacterized protein BC939DRAFT_464442 [Gamsiella multidivaricata]KAI7817893.1 hypothetical protein BC939DRAFT_464442 [Gamsiella multidivaricata]